MTFKNNSSSFTITAYILFVCLLAACTKKQEVIIKSAAAELPSSLSILSINAKDVNKFVVTFKIKTDTAFAYDDYGLVVSKDTFSNLDKGRVYSFGKLSKISEEVDSCILD